LFKVYQTVVFIVAIVDIARMVIITLLSGIATTRYFGVLATMALACAEDGASLPQGLR